MSQKMMRAFSYVLLIALLAGALSGCVSTVSSSGGSGQAPSAAASANTHGSDADPNYSVVFPQESVNRIDITLTAEAWTALQTEMEDQFGAQGTGEPGAGDPGGLGPIHANPPQGNGQPPQPPGDFAGGNPGGGQPGNAPGGNMPAMDFGETSYVSSTVTFNGETWNSVGFRYSGNSTLQNSWHSGTKKISFRLDFDQFEDQDAATRNQRFYGFKQLSFKSNAMDSSYLREKAAGDIFRAAGVTAPQTSFYEVYVDYGEGAQYFGLYTVVEIVDDTLIKTAFTDSSGNVYKPEGSGAAFVDGTFDEASFEKQTNASAGDWSDIKALFAALNATTRSSDPAAWRQGLEAVFDVDAFLRWLAVDTILQNWDTYGAMAHNYYLYADPASGKLTWIPWDNNMSLSAAAGGPNGQKNRDAAQPNPGGGRAGPGGRGVRELDLSSVGEQWPLIRYLIDDPTYQAKYRRYLSETIAGAFQPETLKAKYQAYHDLIAPYVEEETREATQMESIEQFQQSVQTLSQHAQDRYDAVVEYLSKP